MKRSVLQEAPSVLKAIEKAWSDAGKPSEFTIKVFDEGEKNFLGFSKRPAIVSIMFDPRKIETPAQVEATAAQTRRDYAIKNYGSIQPGYARRQRANKHDRSETSERPERYERSERFEHSEGEPRTEERSRGSYHGRPYQNRSGYTESRNTNFPNEKHDYKEDQASENDARDTHYADNYLWTAEAIEDIKSWLKHLTSIMGIGISFNAHSENHLLKIDFEKPVFDAPSEERMLFSSFAYILMQFLKRKHKKKFRGCRLAISSRR